jgi:alkylhydroperoxidase/carboxymuconolactone decarboxylase family protein YurZ
MNEIERANLAAIYCGVPAANAAFHHAEEVFGSLANRQEQEPAR